MATIYRKASPSIFWRLKLMMPLHSSVTRLISKLKLKRIIGKKTLLYLNINKEKKSKTQEV